MASPAVRNVTASVKHLYRGDSVRWGAIQQYIVERHRPCDPRTKNTRADETLPRACAWLRKRRHHMTTTRSILCNLIRDQIEGRKK